MELLIGCGTNREKRFAYNGAREWTDLVTLDMTAEVKPDVVHDLENLPLPFADDTFDGVYAFEVLEHTGRQGDWRFFFAQFSDFWRILKPGGLFVACVPKETSVWLFGDPGHTRVFSVRMLTYLDRSEYRQLGKTTMTDYRPYYSGDFEPLALDPKHPDLVGFVLRAVKPRRDT